MPPVAIARSARTPACGLAARQQEARSPTRWGTSARGPSRPGRGPPGRPASSTAALAQRRVDGVVARRQRGRPPRAPRRPGRPARGSPRACRATRRRPPASTWRHDAMPIRGSGGKYVPPKNGAWSGVRKTFSGQPPWPVIALDRLDVDRVDVGALLAVDLDAHEVLVHQRGGLGVLERLALHDVAPVARRVADRDEQRPVLVARAAAARPVPTAASRRGCADAGGGRERSRSPARWSSHQRERQCCRHASAAARPAALPARAARPEARCAETRWPSSVPLTAPVGEKWIVPCARRRAGDRHRAGQRARPRSCR